MGTFLRNLRKSASSEDLAELQQLVSRLDSQTHRLEQLVQHADRSIGQLQRLATLGERVNAIERQLASMEHVAARLGAAESQLAGLTGSHQRLEADWRRRRVVSSGPGRGRGGPDAVARRCSQAGVDRIPGTRGPLPPAARRDGRAAGTGRILPRRSRPAAGAARKTLGHYKAAGSRIEPSTPTGSGSPARSPKPSTGSRGWTAPGRHGAGGGNGRPDSPPVGQRPDRRRPAGPEGGTAGAAARSGGSCHGQAGAPHGPHAAG